MLLLLLFAVCVMLLWGRREEIAVVRRRIVVRLPPALPSTLWGEGDVRSSDVVRMTAAASRSSRTPPWVVPSTPPPVGGLERPKFTTTPSATSATRTTGAEPEGQGTGQEEDTQEERGRPGP